MNASRSTSRSSSCQHEDGEIIEEDHDVSIDMCIYASFMATGKVLCSPAQILEDGEIVEEEVMCLDVA